MAKNMERNLTEEMTFETENGTFFCEIYHYQELGLGNSIPDGVHIKKYEGKGEDGILEVPKEVNGVLVVAVDTLLKDNNDIEKVIIPETVQTADWIAEDCPNLKEVAFSENTKIRNSAFIKCNGLSEETTAALNTANPWAIAHTSNDGVIYERQGNSIAVIGYDPTKNVAGKGETVFIADEYEGLPVSHIADVTMKDAQDVIWLKVAKNIHVNGGALKDFTSLGSHSAVQILKDHPDAFGKDFDVASVLRDAAKSEQGERIMDDLLREGARLIWGLKAGSKELTHEQTKGIRCLTYSAAMGSKIAESELKTRIAGGLDIGEGNRKLLVETQEMRHHLTGDQMIKLLEGDGVTLSSEDKKALQDVTKQEATEFRSALAFKGSCPAESKQAAPCSDHPDEERSSKMERRKAPIKQHGRVR